jgi:hypothetical protein
MAIDGMHCVLLGQAHRSHSSTSHRCPSWRVRQHCSLSSASSEFFHTVRSPCFQIGVCDRLCRATGVPPVAHGCKSVGKVLSIDWKLRRSLGKNMRPSTCHTMLLMAMHQQRFTLPPILFIICNAPSI